MNAPGSRFRGCWKSCHTVDWCVTGPFQNTPQRSLATATKEEPRSIMAGGQTPSTPELKIVLEDLDIVPKKDLTVPLAFTVQSSSFFIARRNLSISF
ncbi:uncharacterized protein DFL_001772 [Arthrobotrys flagrans]|uniref:Uncharacterized protein n=1 Tax=Arthrobotrys flagrans TaxID=97331 RepID=A0A437A8L8_ARTFL|nr:hypothetical protein DFL_001772 [Arthrobotrys flagrans]